MNEGSYKELKNQKVAAKDKDSDNDLVDDIATDSSGAEEDAPASQSEHEQTDSDQAAKGLRKRKARRD